MLESISYFGTALLMFIIGISITVLLTPQKEFTLIKNGVFAATLAYGGKMLGLALIIGAALENCVNYTDLIIYSSLGIVLQLVTYFVFDLVTKNIKFKEEIEKNNIAVGGLIAFVAVSIGFIGGKALTYRPELENINAMFISFL